MHAIELFAGAGGLGIGVSRAGITPLMVVERDRWCCDTIRENRAANISPVKAWPRPVEDDIRRVDFKEFEHGVHLVTGGPPCQPFSLGGKHKAHADARDMWPEAVRAVREVKPQAFIFENVKGLTRASFNAYFQYITLQLTYPEIAPNKDKDEDWCEHFARLEQHHTAKGKSAEGLTYNLVARVCNAANYGVPQRRERIFFVGFRSDLGVEWTFPTETHSLDALLWDQVRDGGYWDRHEVPAAQRIIAPRLQARGERLNDQPHDVKAWRTVRDALEGLPDPEFDPIAASEWDNHRFQPGARVYPGHTGSPLDEPSKTLKAGVHGVPGGENMLARPDGSVRYFTVRESARLQTFPDEYRFHGAWSETMRQLGNAVAVDMATIIARDVRRYLRPMWSGNA